MLRFTTRSRMTGSTSPEAATEPQPIWRCEKCGWWKPRTLLRELIPLTPNCKYCCQKCAPGMCTTLHNEKPWRHPKVRLWEAVR
jgi:hypothetical protein